MQLTPITTCTLGASPYSYAFAHHWPDAHHWPPLPWAHPLQDPAAIEVHAKAKAPRDAMGADMTVTCHWPHLNIAPLAVHLHIPSTTHITGFHCHAQVPGETVQALV